ncbi:hypothetical protein GTW25_02690 [Aliihoeflea aestuarii]|uniref:hypothetical protein n=1 Tax=Aliihoeflea aestuarii TaxID=453840 RepID=UPI0020931156|nr:hypothetical protein [Aliihoeflea aestuarii]MCO6389935.1 hypothetical protein [Aliihoeflea aestuarii]
MSTKLEKAARLRELFEQIDSAALECREIMRSEPMEDRSDWKWSLDIHEYLYGHATPTMTRTIERLEAEAARAA